MLSYTCNTCKCHLAVTRYHCARCDDFDLCVQCYERHSHGHPMDKLGFGDVVTGSVNRAVPVPSSSVIQGGSWMLLDAIIDHTSASDGSSNASAHESIRRRLSIARCIENLVHATRCRDANCGRSGCDTMKRVICHAKACMKRSSRQLRADAQSTINCRICKQLIALCCYHAKHCEQNQCSVPYCAHIKRKIRTQRLQRVPMLSLR